MIKDFIIIITITIMLFVKKIKNMIGLFFIFLLVMEIIKKLLG